MIEVKGKFNTAKVFTDNVEDTAMKQIVELCNQEFAKGSKIRIMPDTHAGAGCTIGTTMTIQDKIVPNLVGVDIGCGMEVAIIQVDKDKLNFDQLDETINKFVPSGFGVHSRNQRHPYSKLVNFRDIQAPFKLNRVKDSMGTLGGGNHFIEVNDYDEDKIALVIHSGSRSLGMSIATHYQDLAYEELIDTKQQKQELIQKLKVEGREQEIQSELKKIKAPKVKKDLAYLEDENFKRYMNDMKIAQQFAALNRKAMVDIITTKMGWDIVDGFTTIHNYIDMDNMILRKGAVSASKGERLIVPINMRDGSIVAYGKGNDDWNQSAPHGAGRVLSRSKAKETLDLKEFEQTMKNVWSKSVVESTLDESPFAYKEINEILDNSSDSIDVDRVMKPLYNFKAK